jgi:hypothetical protein
MGSVDGYNNWKGEVGKLQPVLKNQTLPKMLIADHYVAGLLTGILLFHEVAPGLV